MAETFPITFAFLSSFLQNTEAINFTLLFFALKWQKNGRKYSRGLIFYTEQKKVSTIYFLGTVTGLVNWLHIARVLNWSEIRSKRIFFSSPSCCESGEESREEIFRVFAKAQLRMTRRNKKKLPRNRFLNKNKTSCSENDKLVEKLLRISLTTCSNPLRGPKLVVRTRFEFQLLIPRLHAS